MPRRAHNLEQPAFATPLMSPESDIPWFANFGKFVDNPDFFVYQRGSASTCLLQTDPYDMINPSETTSHISSFHNMDIASIPTVNSLHVPALDDMNTDVMHLKPTHTRASSVSVPPTNTTHGFNSQTRVRKLSRPSRSSRADEEAPKTLGAILRRMVSFDQYSTRNLAREQERLRPMYGTPRNSRDRRFRTGSDNPHLFPADQSDVLPPTVPFEESGDAIDHLRQTMEYSTTARDPASAAGNARRPGYRGRHCDSEPPKTLGAIIRRMVSVDQYSRRSLSRAHEVPLDESDANIRSGVPIQEVGRSRRTAYHVDAQVRSMRRW